MYGLRKTSITSDAAAKFFNVDEIVKFLDRHKAGKEDNSRKVWTIYMFLVWYKKFFGEENKEVA